MSDLGPSWASCFIIPPPPVVWGLYRIHLVRPSVRPSVRLSVRPSVAFHRDIFIMACSLKVIDDINFKLSVHDEWNMGMYCSKFYEHFTKFDRIMALFTNMLNLSY